MAHGNQPFVAWYLEQMRGYEQRYGVRILDYLDEHIYPQAPGVLDGRTDEASNALRLRSTRGLWDASYVDESWIKQPVRLIPRLREWVDAHYPGTKIAISEYNWGALNHISGALAQADILGIFGRERLDFATLWAPPRANDAAAFAFRMYRNYDGQGNGFGNIGFKAVSADQDKVAIYAARRGNDGPMTLMVINKTSEPQTSTVKLSGFPAAASAQVYRYSGSSPDRIVPVPDQPIVANAFAAELPPYSISLYRIAPAANGGDRLPEGCGSGGILREVWTGIGGTSVADLSAAASFKSAPSASSRLARFQTPSDAGDNFGARIRGTLCTKTSGSYTFWIASDDTGELWLSTSDKPDQKRLIARSAAWVSPLQWDKVAGQKSVAITLEAGRHYYIEALHKEGASADHLAVAWQGPEFARQLIDGRYLSPSAIVTPPPPASGCRVAYVVGNQWQNGFTADVSVTNTGSSPINGWTLQWEFPADQRVGNAWNAAIVQNGSGVTARNAAWNAVLAPGSGAGFGFQGTYTGSNPPPSSFTLNGTVCTQ